VPSTDFKSDGRPVGLRWVRFPHTPAKRLKQRCGSAKRKVRTWFFVARRAAGFDWWGAWLVVRPRRTRSPKQRRRRVPGPDRPGKRRGPTDACRHRSSTPLRDDGAARRFRCIASVGSRAGLPSPMMACVGSPTSRSTAPSPRRRLVVVRRSWVGSTAWKPRPGLPSWTGAKGPRPAADVSAEERLPGLDRARPPTEPKAVIGVDARGGGLGGFPRRRKPPGHRAPVTGLGDGRPTERFSARGSGAPRPMRLEQPRRDTSAGCR
jgi:hypothetical protein